MTPERLNKILRQIKAGTYETRERIDGTVERIECDVLRQFVTRGMDTQRAIDELTEHSHA